eukprot:1146901-Pelagomonas_calceolata.AAC.2
MDAGPKVLDSIIHAQLRAAVQADDDVLRLQAGSVRRRARTHALYHDGCAAASQQLRQVRLHMAQRPLVGDLHHRDAYVGVAHAAVDAEARHDVLDLQGHTHRHTELRVLTSMPKVCG